MTGKTIGKRDVRRVLGRSCLITGLSVCVTVCMTTVLMLLVYGEVHRLALQIAVCLPLFVAFPVSCLIEVDRRLANRTLKDLSIAHQKLHQMYGELAARAQVDALTGIMNREAVLVALADRLDNGEEGALLVLDADRFKRINDTFGHLTGDRALKTMTDAISKKLPEDCLFGRLGGEEFVIFIPSVHGRSVHDLSEACRSAVADCDFLLDTGEPYVLTVSIGTIATDPQTTLHDLIDRADRAMYRAKEEGGNRVLAA